MIARRAGAGRRPLMERAGVSHAPRTPFSTRRAVLVSMRLTPGLPSLRTKKAHAAFLSAIEMANARKDFELVHYVLLKDHVHLIAEASSTKTMSVACKAFANA